MVKRLEKEETLSLEDLRLNRFEYLYQDEGKPGTIDCSITYGIDLPLPLEFGRRGEFEQRLFFRGFIGAMDNEEGMGFDAMEKPDSASIVYVFPRAGKRFHKPDCRMIEVYPKEMILSSGVRNRYFPCKLCDADSLPWGSRVYCFDKSGKVFHKGSCSTVDRYVIGIDRMKPSIRSTAHVLFLRRINTNKKFRSFIVINGEEAEIIESNGRRFYTCDRS